MTQETKPGSWRDAIPGAIFLTLGFASPWWMAAGGARAQLAGAVALGAFALATSQAAPAARAPWSWKSDTALLAAVLALALLLRVQGLQCLPGCINADEGVDGNTALDILDGKSVGPVDTQAFRGETLGFAHLAAASARLLGADVWTLRLPVALLNALGCPAVYALLRLLAGRGPAMTGAVWFALSPWNIYFARLINGMGELPGLAALALLLLCLAMKLGSALLAFAAGLAIGAMVHVHLAALVLAGALLPVGVLLSRAIARPPPVESLRLAATAAVGLAVALAPLYPYRADLTDRLRGNTFLFGHPPADDFGVRQVADVLLERLPCRSGVPLGTAWALPWLGAGAIYWTRRIRLVGFGALAVPLLWIFCSLPPLLTLNERVDARRFLLLETASPLLAAGAVAGAGASALLARTAPLLACAVAVHAAFQQLTGPMYWMLDRNAGTGQQRVLRYGGELARGVPVAVPLFAIAYPDLKMLAPVAPELTFLARLYKLRDLAPGSSLAHRASAGRLIWHAPEGLPDAEEEELRSAVGNFGRWSQKTGTPGEWHLWHLAGGRQQYLQCGLRRVVISDRPHPDVVLETDESSLLEAPLPSGTSRVCWGGSLYCAKTGWYDFECLAQTPSLLEIDHRTLRDQDEPWSLRALLHRGYHDFAFHWTAPLRLRQTPQLLRWRPHGERCPRPLGPTETLPFTLQTSLFKAPPTVETPTGLSLVSIWTQTSRQGQGPCRLRARNGLAVGLAGDPLGTVLRVSDGERQPDLLGLPRLPLSDATAQDHTNNVSLPDLAWLADGSFRLSWPSRRTVLGFGADGRALAELSAEGRFEAPGALAADEKRARLFVADPSAGKLHRFSTNGRREASFDAVPATSLAVLPSGDLAVYSARTGRLAVYGPAGALLRQWMSPTTSAFGDLALDARHEWLLVLCPEDSRIVRFTLDGRLAGPPSDIPPADPDRFPEDRTALWRGLCVAAGGELLVAGRNCVQALRWQEPGR
ncbi:MAG: glycosyltransferase family 39 protein [Candidatus Wallbacteria bacterium]|nr:glycosyltransferase family 39 protein [Candidatus Wallbacteria bacterium]